MQVPRLRHGTVAAMIAVGLLTIGSPTEAQPSSGCIWTTAANIAKVYACVQLANASAIRETDAKKEQKYKVICKNDVGGRSLLQSCGNSVNRSLCGSIELIVAIETTDPGISKEHT